MTTFEHEITVRFRDVDRAGIVYFGCIFDYCHIAVEAMLEALDCGIAANFEDSDGFGFPLVHLDADFKAPMLHGDKLTVSIQVETLGTKSMTLAFAIRGPRQTAPNADLRATARFVHACVSVQSFSPRPLPERFIAGLKRLGLISTDTTAG